MSDIVVVRRTQASVLRAHTELASLPGLRWAGGTQALGQAADLIIRSKPELLLCDLRLVGGNATHLLKALRKSAYDPLVLLITPSADDLLLFHAMCAGAHGYAIDKGSPTGLGHAVRDLLSDQASMSPMIARQLLESFGETRTPMRLAMQPPTMAQANESERLVESDRRLLSLLAHGLLADEIARAWGLALEQIGRLIARLYRKLHHRYRLNPLPPAAT